ncbi:MAG: right-handed parallel beta-helix repeat-containing protein [Candidatus Electrothrix scaldis]|nr:MAG: right-handed parallel beta-helix repeat-containing protein [Candidatus Electrothrix sp. GW3-3]
MIRERAVGNGLMNGGVSIVEDNRVDQTGSVGIAVNSSTVLRLNRNQISKTGSPGIVLVFGSKVHEMKDNTMTNTRGPKLVVEESEIYSR